MLIAPPAPLHAHLVQPVSAGASARGPRQTTSSRSRSPDRATLETYRRPYMRVNRVRSISPDARLRAPWGRQRVSREALRRHFRIGALRLPLPMQTPPHGRFLTRPAQQSGCGSSWFAAGSTRISPKGAEPQRGTRATTPAAGSPSPARRPVRGRQSSNARLLSLLRLCGLAALRACARFALICRQLAALEA